MNTEEYNVQLVNELLDGIDEGDFNNSEIIFQKYRYEHLAALQMMASYLDGGENLYIQIYDIVMQQAIARIKRKKEAGKKLKIYFLAISAAEWSAEDLYRKLKNNDNIECKIVVSPLVDRDKNGMLDSYIQTFQFFKENGYNVVEGYNFETDQIISFESLSKEVDIVIHLTPWYSSMPESYRITSYSLAVLNCYIPYGIYLANSKDGSYIKQCVYNKEFVNFQWRVYADSLKNLEGYKQYGMLCGKNVVYSGYAKMDTFFRNKEYTEDELKKMWKIPKNSSVHTIKKIIIAPHHAILGYGGILFSTFPYNAYFLYYIAEKYKEEVTFILKPHPSLRVRAVEAKVFGSYEEYDEYIKKWQELPNAKVIQDGDYTDIFKSSDGMIMDSVSFLGEYLYLNKPLLFLQREGQAFNELGERIVQNYYTVNGRNYKGIEKFLQDVILDGNDVMAERRKEVFEEELNYYKYNGCSACEYIYRDIINIL